jgi:hypothetical protein
LGCQIQPRAENKAIFIITNGNEEENEFCFFLILLFFFSYCFNKIFEILKFAEDANNDTQKLKFKIITRMLISNQKCGYVVGRNGTTLKKIEVFLL